jgi:ribosome-associated heat shock protein Hsp15
MRVDKWLWAARFFKTRSLAQRGIASGRVSVNGARVKPAHELKVGDLVVLKKDDVEWKLVVQMLSQRRGSAQVARTLYEETDASRSERQRRQDLRRFAPEPAAGLKGRPTKRDRRTLDSFTRGEED